jgi:hypothetical protein
LGGFSAVLGAFEGGEGLGGFAGAWGPFSRGAGPGGPGGGGGSPSDFFGFTQPERSEEAGLVLVLKLRARPWQASKAPARAATKAGVFVWLWPVAGNEARRKWPGSRQDHVHSKQKCAVHGSLWPNTVLNNTSLHTAKSTGFGVVLCLYAAPAPMLYSYCALPLHFHYTSTTLPLQYTTVHCSARQYTAVHETERDGTRRMGLLGPQPNTLTGRGVGPARPRSF